MPVNTTEVPTAPLVGDKFVIVIGATLEITTVALTKQPMVEVNVITLDPADTPTNSPVEELMVATEGELEDQVPAVLGETDKVEVEP